MSPFIPAVTLDLNIATPKSFETATEEFHNFAKTAPKVALNLSDGWHTIDPAKAEQLLLRNPLGANRKVKLASVRYYAEQMLLDEWQKTGQAVILTDRDLLIDGQHRVFACYFSGKPFTTYVITNVPHFNNIFAYIDAGTVRTNTDALMTAGLNGQSTIIGQAIVLNHLYQTGNLKVKGRARGVTKMSPVEIIRSAAAHPILGEVAHLQVSEYKAATTIVKFKDVAVFVAWQIAENHNLDIVDEFMTALGEGGIPMFASLRKLFEADAKSENPMGKAGRVAYLVKLFNAWFTKQPSKKIFVRIDEEFPRFMGKNESAPEQNSEAAE